MNVAIIVRKVLRTIVLSMLGSLALDPRSRVKRDQLVTLQSILTSTYTTEQNRVSKHLTTRPTSILSTFLRIFFLTKSNNGILIRTKRNILTKRNLLASLNLLHPVHIYADQTALSDERYTNREERSCVVTADRKL